MTNLKNIINIALKRGGITYSLYTGKELGKIGYTASLESFEERYNISDGINVLNADLKSFVERNGLLLDEPANYLGLWIENGKIFFDISQHFENKEAALSFAQENNQLAIFDLKRNLNIYL